MVVDTHFSHLNSGAVIKCYRRSIGIYCMFVLGIYA
jgi:hypothetical protein